MPSAAPAAARLGPGDPERGEHRVARELLDDASHGDAMGHAIEELGHAAADDLRVRSDELRRSTMSRTLSRLYDDTSPGFDDMLISRLMGNGLAEHPIADDSPRLNRRLTVGLRMQKTSTASPLTTPPHTKLRHDAAPAHHEPSELCTNPDDYKIACSSRTSLVRKRRCRTRGNRAAPTEGGL